MNLTIVLALLIAICAILVFAKWGMRFLLRRIARTVLSEIGQRALNRTPDQIKLSRVDSPAWTNATAVELQAVPLRSEGFEDVGVYCVDKMPGVLIRMMHHPETYVAAHIFDHPRVGSWIEFVARYTDCSTDTLTTLAPTGLEHPQWVRTIRADKDRPTDQLYSQFRAERQAHSIKPIAANDVIHEFEDAYLRFMIWRQNSGITPEEVARVAVKWGKKRGGKTGNAALGAPTSAMSASGTSL